jgi:hypothetical protein
MPEFWLWSLRLWGLPAVGRRTTSLGPGTGISRSPGPGGDHSCSRGCLAPLNLPYGLDASGLPSPRAEWSRMPFVLTTPGGQPVPVFLTSSGASRPFFRAMSEH